MGEIQTNSKNALASAEALSTEFRVDGKAQSAALANLVRAISVEIASQKGWDFSPSSIKVGRATGLGTNISHKFAISGSAFVLVFWRLHLTGGTGQADLVISLDSGTNAAYDVALYTIEGAGKKDYHFRVPRQELSQWVFQDGDEILFSWTNPSGAYTWGLEVGLLKATLDVSGTDDVSTTIAVT